MCQVERQTSGRARIAGRIVTRKTYAVSLALAALGMFGVTDTALACFRNIGGQAANGRHYDAYNPSLFQIYTTAAMLEYAVPADPTPGQTLFSTVDVYLPRLTGEAEGQAAPLYACQAGTMEHFNGHGGLVSGFSDVYATGVEGIGYRVYYFFGADHDGGGTPTSYTAPVTFINDFKRGVLAFPISGSYGGDGVRTRIDFVATSNVIKPGVISTARVYGQSTVTGPIVPPTGPLYRVGLGRNITIKTATCSISNPAALTVTMPPVPASLIQENANFHATMTNITVTCSSSSLASPSVKVTAANQVSGHASTLANQETGSAAALGVGIRMWLDDPEDGSRRLVAFNQTEYGLGTPQGSLPGKVWQFRFGGSYVKVGPTVRGGRVKATATLTFTYV